MAESEKIEFLKDLVNVQIKIHDQIGRMGKEVQQELQKMNGLLKEIVSELKKK